MCNNWQNIEEKIICNFRKQTGIIDSTTTENWTKEIEEVQTLNTEGEDDWIGFISDSESVQMCIGEKRS